MHQPEDLSILLQVTQGRHEDTQQTSAWTQAQQQAALVK